MTNFAYIIEAKRSPIGKFGGSLANTPITNIAGTIIKNIVLKYPSLKSKINEVIIGNVLSSGLGQNPARIVSYKAGLKVKIPSFTVNYVCGSGLKSIILATQSILNEDAHLILAGGMENMSRSPYLLNKLRDGVKFGDQTIEDSMLHDGLICGLTHQHMALTAEKIANKFKITRQEQDKYALYSHKKAINAINKNKFRDEIVPIKISDGKTFDIDEQPRKDTSIEKLNNLKPLFKKNGSVTAGNASSINDAASILLIGSEKNIKMNKLKPLAKIVAYDSIGLDPNYMGLGSFYATDKLLKKTGLKKTEIDLWEINEAFASQSIAVIKLLGIDANKVNVNGGAIAIGHPIGASGARILTTLLYELKRKKLQYGIASLCIGGGQGIAVLIENL